MNGETYFVSVNEFSAMCNCQVVRVQVEQNRCKDRALRKAVTLGSPRTGVIAHVHPETSILKQQTHQSVETNMTCFYSVCKEDQCAGQCHMLLLSPVRQRFRFCWNPFSMKVVRAATWSQVLRPLRKPAWSGLSKLSTVEKMR